MIVASQLPRENVEANPATASPSESHATTRMIVDVYDSFLGPDAWPDEEEIVKLRALYGWSEIRGPVVDSIAGVEE